MSNVQMRIDADNNGAFFIEHDNREIAEMDFSEKTGELVVHHTEVDPDFEDQGLGKLMLGTMVEYARSKNLKVVPLCRFVLIQFKRNKQEYADLWQPDEEL